VFFVSQITRTLLSRIRKKNGIFLLQVEDDLAVEEILRLPDIMFRYARGGRAVEV
jgi:hypothetical protein